MDEEDSEAILGPEENRKSFKCPQCPSTFSHKGNIPRHISNVHEGKKRTNLEIKEENVDLKSLDIKLEENSFRGEFNIIGSLVFIWIYYFSSLHCRLY